jgi:hypothetical protein
VPVKGETVDLSRRSFLKRSSMAAALAGVATAAPMLVTAGESAGPAGASAASEVPEAASMSEPVIAHLSSLASGEVNVYVGTRQVTVNDPHLASLLYHASR